MKFLVVGLGSMGKRRIRNLGALGHSNIAGFDIREDRRFEANEKYGVATFEDFGAAVEDFQPDAMVISTSPESHMLYARQALSRGLPSFLEASVVDADGVLALSEDAQRSGVIFAPSCTMRFYPGPKKVKELIEGGEIGKVLNFNYQTGQWLPDWHPWEDIKDFYVSNPKTGGCREIVPFELTWLNDVFGTPEPLACVKEKLSEMDADIDDIYHCIMRYPDGAIGNLTVEVLSRPIACREMRVIGTQGQIVFSADENVVRWATTENPDWAEFKIASGTVESGYINPEEPYIAELDAFVDAVRHGDAARFPNSLRDDYDVLQTLDRLEGLATRK